MRAVLLDTSVLIDYLRRKDRGEALLFKLTQKTIDFKISIITHTELYAGKSVWESSKAKESMESFLKKLEILAYDVDLSYQAGRMKAHYGVNLADAIIAATAIKESLPLVTFNKKHFGNVEGLELVDLI